jgi:hypothetical protein
VVITRIAEYLRHKRATDPDFHLVGADEAPLDMEREPESAGYRPSLIVEGDGTYFSKHAPYAEDGASGFTHFLDGIQRSRLVGYQGIVPLVYGYAAAAIRTRRGDRTLATWGEAVVKEAIYAPLSEIDVTELEERGVPLTDTSSSMPAGEAAHPARYRQAAIAAIQRNRESAESEVARKWVQSADAHDGWLFVDGSLTFATQHARVAGVVKSHQTQYFPPQEQSKILRMAAGERSAVFQPGFGEAAGGDVYSWYLRLRPNASRDLFYGLIRIEVDRRPEAVGDADRISAWLMAERQPIAAPDPRWDKLFYPIRDCEEYLRSIAPSPTMIDACFL